jgi:cytosine/adenosine deaminase-related metal-dependent hydrolase
MAVFDRITSLEHDYFCVQFCPVGPQWVCDEAFALIAKLSAESGRRIHMRLLETSWQHEWADSQYSSEFLLGHLDKLGLLSARLTIAHGVHLNLMMTATCSKNFVFSGIYNGDSVERKCLMKPIFLKQHV